MDDKAEVYVIPTNIADNGNVLNGYFKKKNAYEAAFFLFIGAILSVVFLGFLPMIPRLIVFGIFLILAFISLAGIKGQSFIEFLLEVVFFKRKKRVMKYRLPRKEIEKTTKRRKKEKDNLIE